VDRPSRRLALAAGLLAASVLAAAGLAGWWRGRNVGPVQRGALVAERSGCFGCHGRGGVTGLENPGDAVGGVPPLTADALQSYAENAAELREWVRDGAPRRVREEQARFPLEDPAPLLQMPAFAGVLSSREIADVASWLAAVGEFDVPGDGPAEAGRLAAGRLGCFGCHGPGGRGDPPNPGSLKGYIPAWNGQDFPELVRDEPELREWVLDGAPARLREHGVARWFLERQAVRMPAYRDRIAAADVDAIVAYIRWLRGGQLP
jgi:mono/diheme cytochrome c family protein